MNEGPPLWYRLGWAISVAVIFYVLIRIGEQL